VVKNHNSKAKEHYSFLFLRPTTNKHSETLQDFDISTNELAFARHMSSQLSIGNSSMPTNETGQPFIPKRHGGLRHTTLWPDTGISSFRLQLPPFFCWLWAARSPCSMHTNARLWRCIDHILRRTFLTFCWRCIDECFNCWTGSR